MNVRVCGSCGSGDCVNVTYIVKSFEWVIRLDIQALKKLRDHFKMISFSGFAIYWYVFE